MIETKDIQPAHRLSCFRIEFERRLRLTCLLAVATVFLTGCPRSPSKISETLADQTEIAELPPEPLILQVAGASELGPIISRQWSARRGGDLTIIDVSADLFRKNGFRIEDQADVVIYSSGLLGELSERNKLLDVPFDVWNSEEINKAELLKQARTTQVNHDSRIWGVPLGSPTLMLVYREDLLEQCGVEVPTTWDQFGKTLEKIQAAELEISKSDRLALPSSPGWCANLLLTRVAAAIRHRGKLSTVFDRGDMQPLIATQPFVLALEDLQKWSDASGWLEQQLLPTQVYQRISSGECVMGLTWPSAGAVNGSDDAAETIVASVDSAVTDSIAVAAVPGMDQWYDGSSERWMNRSPDDSIHVDLIGFSGLVASVTADTTHSSTAFDFLQWLTSKQTSVSVIAGQPLVGPFRASHLGQPELWTGSLINPATASRYADLVKQTNDASVVFMFPRIPGYQDYLDALDREIRKCLAKKEDALIALQQVEKEWEAITEELGRKKQIASLRRSSGL